MRRICPSCKSDINCSGIYFCLSCGSLLPENLQKKKIDFKSVKEKKAKERKIPSLPTVSISNPVSNLKDFNWSGVIVGIFLGFIISVLFYFIFFSNTLVIKRSNGALTSENNNPNLVANEKQTVSRPGVVEMDLGINPGTFGQNSIYDYVPYDIDIYFEFSDPSALEPYFSFLGGEFFTLTENIKGKTTSSYAVFSMSKALKRDWVAIVYLSDKDLNVGTYKNLITEKIDNFLVVSNEPLLIDEVRLSKSGISKSLALHHSLISIKNIIPSDGKIFILKTTKDGDKVINDLVNKTTSSDFKSVVKKFIELDNSYLIVK